jgi:hypothetical protein
MQIEEFPFACRKADEKGNRFIRELVIAFGGTGHLTLFGIDDNQTVTALAVRHQREEDYIEGDALVRFLSSFARLFERRKWRACSSILTRAGRADPSLLKIPVNEAHAGPGQCQNRSSRESGTLLQRTMKR